VRKRLAELVVWFGLRRLVTGAAAVCVLAVGGWWVVRVPPVPVESTIAFTTTSVAGGVSASALVIVVHVAVEVNVPGVYSLAAGSRMVDALDAAGGPTNRADLEVINLATPITDATQIYVPARNQTARPTFRRPQPGVNGGVNSGATGQTDDQQGGVININRASAAELEQLPGVVQRPRRRSSIIERRTVLLPHLKTYLKLKALVLPNLRQCATRWAFSTCVTKRQVLLR
jgi:DNA uptake protein ComE-like DNA-binding protein